MGSISLKWVLIVPHSVYSSHRAFFVRRHEPKCHHFNFQQQLSILQEIHTSYKNPYTHTTLLHNILQNKKESAFIGQIGPYYTFDFIPILYTIKKFSAI